MSENTRVSARTVRSARAALARSRAKTTTGKQRALRRSGLLDGGGRLRRTKDGTAPKLNARGRRTLAASQRKRAGTRAKTAAGTTAAITRSVRRNRRRSR